MAKEFFKNFAFRPETRKVIRMCNEIIEYYQGLGFTMTLRQLYYQMVSQHNYPNTVQSYKRLGSIVNDARLAGKIDWGAIEDRTRNVRKLPSWTTPESILRAVSEQYREDPWLQQDYAPEVWIEKDALVGVIEGICNRLRVPYFACRGYTSQSETYEAGKRFQWVEASGRRPIVLHLGDHDPSGIDMTRDNADRLMMFAGVKVKVRRLALNMPQVEEYDPPPNPAKETDARFSGYQEQFGDESWELDALPPDVIASLIEDAVSELIDEHRWAMTMGREEEHKAVLAEIAARYSDVGEFLKGKDENG